MRKRYEARASDEAFAGHVARLACAGTDGAAASICRRFRNDLCSLVQAARSRAFSAIMAAADLRAFRHRPRALRLGQQREDFQEVPMVALINPLTGIEPRHPHFRRRLERARRGAWRAGAFRSSRQRNSCPGTSWSGWSKRPFTPIATPARRWLTATLSQRQAGASHLAAGVGISYAEILGRLLHGVTERLR